MIAVVRYEGPVHIEREDGTIEILPMEGQVVEIIGTEGDSIYVCQTVGYPWVGTFKINKEDVMLIEGR